MVLNLRKVFILLLIFTNSFYLFAAQKVNTEKEKIFVIGDSITDGYGVDQNKAYPALLALQVKEKFPNMQIIPSAISGSVTASASSRLNWLLRKEKNIKGIIVVLGGNDLMRGIKPETMQKGYQKLLQVADEAKLPVLLAPMQIPMNYAMYQKDLENIYNKLRNDKRVTILEDFFKGVIGVSALNQTDGIHPNEIGHALIAKNIAPQVLSWITKIQKDKK